MSIQYSVAVRNARLDATEVEIGTAPILKIRSGAKPVNCAAADAGSVLSTVTLPSDWLAPASGGSKAKAGTWEDATADADGNAGHFRIYDSGGSTCHIQGTVTATGGGGDMEVDNVSFATGQDFQVTSFSITAGNA